MFDALTDRLGGIFDGLTGRGALSEKDVTAALREIRVALLEADVALPVVKDFISKVKERAVGEEVIRSVKPGQQVIKIVHDGLVDMLGGPDAETRLRVDNPPSVIMMAGLQGSGKTTTTGKIAKRLADRDKKKVLLASLDVRRPAAMEQLAILADQAGENVKSLPIVEGQMPAEITRRALQAAKLGGYDVLFLDTAGRILGQGDIVSLVEKAGDQFDQEKAERMAKKMRKGEFDLNDLADQLRQMQKMGGLGGIMGLLPGAKKAKQAMASANMDDNMIKRQEAIISSMTKKERAKPALLNASRRKRIAAGAGVSVQDVNKLLKMHRQMADMMKKIGKGGMKGMMNALGGAGVSQADIAKMGQGAALPGGMGGGQLPGLGGNGLPPGMGGGKKK